jgi:hypothetical protein
MYTNTLTQEVTKAIENILTSQDLVSYHFLQELLKLLEIMFAQNYIHFNRKQHKQINGLAMGVHTSPLLAEMFIQYLEHNQMLNILKNTVSLDTSGTLTLY